MKALVLEDYMKLVYKDVPEPEILPDEVLIRVMAAGICGSDVHGIDGSTGRRIPPIIMGHEASGVISKVGEKVKGWKIGERVTFDSTIYRLDDWYTQRGLFNLSDGRKVIGVSTKDFKQDGAFAEYVVVPEHILSKIPDNVTFSQAAMVEPASVALHSIKLTPLSVNDTVVVIGTGMVGLFVVQLLKIRGCNNIIAVDVDQIRLNLACHMGAIHTFNPKVMDLCKEVKNLTDGRGAETVFEVVGLSSSIQDAIGCARKGGTVTLVGNISPVVEIPLQEVVTRQLRLQGSCAINGEYPEVIDMMAKELINTNALISVEAPLSEGPLWFHRLYHKEGDLMKVILKPLIDK